MVGAGAVLFMQAATPGKQCSAAVFMCTEFLFSKNHSMQPQKSSATSAM